MTDDWHPDLQRAAAEYSPGYVITAFRVKEKLEDSGYSGIGFMQTTEAYLEQFAPMVVHNMVERAMNEELRANGLQ
jgi:hypothetical protein